MTCELGQLKPGDTYGNGKYRVIDNDGETIGIIRIADNHRIRFHNEQINWKHKVTKDTSPTKRGNTPSRTYTAAVE